ncbi:C40 family peptidase [Halobacillus sp. A5]|uniref:C40 family peptidase n=1 Tax=Halobacillus sp. A5 TaxID=2880263 RepID=UPI0020A68C17|nr:NlpC/P60 family protein [Halobacillus sp. A5]MCP3026403.1 NlpC/P60 family protein [Halobacillus sp. A5]
MTKSTTMRKYVISSAIVTSLALTPVLTENVSANADPTSTESSSSADTSSIISSGDQGDQVESVQSELETHGYYTAAIDGIFGPLTEDAVKSFQSDEGLAVDGIVGPETESVLASSPEESTEEEPAPEEPAEEEPAADSEVVSIAEDLIGTPYVWGGTSAEGVDSSGLIYHVFEQVGVDLNRTESDMWLYDGEEVNSPEVGDVVFFEGTYDTEGASHSGIYIGDNQMIHAGSDGVEVADMSIDYWQDHYLGVKSFK